MLIFSGCRLLVSANQSLHYAFLEEKNNALYETMKLSFPLMVLRHFKLLFTFNFCLYYSSDGGLMQCTLQKTVHLFPRRMLPLLCLLQPAFSWQTHSDD